jgi:[acyl-carrier-protein] S-malonyltransferase
MKQKFAFVFPGQGSQSSHMLVDVTSHSPVAFKIMQQASHILGYDLGGVFDEEPVSRLNETVYTQPAMLVADWVMWNVWLSEKGELPALVAGHSLGEYAALAVAGVLSFPDALHLVSCRAELMQAAVKSEQGAMAVVIGLNEEQINTICQEASIPELGVVQVANFNSPGQVVVAGHTRAVDKAIELAKQMGSKLSKRLPVSVPAHCLLMKPAAQAFEKELRMTSFEKPKIPVIHNVDGQTYQDPNDIRQALVKQLYSPVRWIETIQAMINQKISMIVECGPGKVLTGLNKRIVTNVTLYTLNSLDSLKVLLQELS